MPNKRYKRPQKSKKKIIIISAVIMLGVVGGYFGIVYSSLATFSMNVSSTTTHNYYGMVEGEWVITGYGFDLKGNIASILLFPMSVEALEGYVTSGSGVHTNVMITPLTLSYEFMTFSFSVYGVSSLPGPRKLIITSMTYNGIVYPMHNVISF